MIKGENDVGIKDGIIERCQCEKGRKRVTRWCLDIEKEKKWEEFFFLNIKNKKFSQIRKKCRVMIRWCYDNEKERKRKEKKWKKKLVKFSDLWKKKKIRKKCRGLHADATIMKKKNRKNKNKK